MTNGSDIRFADFLSERQILCHTEWSARDDLLKTLVEQLHGVSDGFDEAAVFQAVLDREAVSPTVIAPGVALPHARVEGLAELHVAVATSANGIDFNDPDGPPVQLVILVLTPKTEPGAYLRLVAALTRELSAPNAVKRIALCTSAADVYDLFKQGTESLPDHLNAADVMLQNPVTLRESDTLADAIAAFSKLNLYDIPIVDEVGDIRGIVSVEDILRLSLPEHLLWMEDLSPILNFQPFAELLKKDHETKLADFMREDFISITPDTPAIQLAKMFLRHEVRQIQVVEGRHLAGVVNIQSFISQLFWA